MDTQFVYTKLKEARKILSEINFAEYSCIDMDWDFEVKLSTEEDLMLIRTSFMRKDIDDGTFGKGWGRWHTTPLSTLTEKAVIMTAWVCIKMIIEHELLESFEYKGNKVFDPHKPLEHLIYPNKL